MTKPFSQACENNKEPLLRVLKEVFAEHKIILEIGSGTGQHAVHFAAQLPHLFWQTADQLQYHPGITQWLTAANLENIGQPTELNVDMPDWQLPVMPDGFFSANTLHIMSWASVQNFFIGVGKHLPQDGVLCVYGPFNYNGQYTSDSNAGFDQWLKNQDSHSAIRDFEAVCELASEQGLQLQHDYEMPANNRLLCWHKQ